MYKNISSKLLLVLLIFMIMPGCHSYVNHAYTVFTHDDDPFSLNLIPHTRKVEVYSTTDISKEYKIISHLYGVTDQTRVEVVVDLLKKEAARIGADAIVDLKLRYQIAGLRPLGIQATGTAVVYHDRQKFIEN
jgi:hypothetical protein